MAKTTTRWGHPYPEGTDAADVPKRIEELAKSVDGVAMDDQGSFSSRPAAGKAGRYYYATDEGVLYRDNGSDWYVVSSTRGRSIVTAEQNRTGTGFDLLTTPDRVEGIKLKADDLLCIAFWGEFKSSSAGAGRAALFVGESEMEQLAIGGSAQEAATKSEEAGFSLVASHPLGLAGSESSIGVQPLPVPVGISAKGTRQMIGGSLVTESAEQLGGVCVVRADPGTLKVEVRWRATSGSVTAKNRRLWVWTQAFPA